VDNDLNEPMLLHTLDGETWIDSHLPLQQANFNTITFTDSLHGWFVGDVTWVPIIFATENGGSYWDMQTTPLKSGTLTDVFFVNPDTGWAAGRSDDGAVVLQTVNGGEKWTTLSVPEGNSASSLFFLSGKEGFITVNSDTSALYETGDGGDTWAQVATAVPEPYIDKVQVVRGSIHIFLLFSKYLALLERLKETGIDSIAVTPKKTTITSDDSTHFTAKAFDKNKNELYFTPTWSSSGGTIDSQTGWFKSDTEGEYIITASTEGSYVTGTATVTVIPATLIQADKTINTAVGFALAQNYPNPFNPVTEIEYTVKEQCQVQLKIYDILGNEVAVLVNEPRQPGHYKITFNAAHLATGLYFYQISMQDYKQVRKMVVMR